MFVSPESRDTNYTSTFYFKTQAFERGLKTLGIMLKHLLLISALLCWTLQGYSQIDSIDDQLDDMPRNEETIVWLLKSIDKLNTSDNVSQFYYANLAIKWSEEIGYKKGVAKGNNVLGTSYWTSDDYDNALKHYLIALSIVDEIKDVKSAAVLSVNIGIIYDELGQHEKALGYAKKGLAEFEKLGDESRISRSQMNLGVVHFYLNQFDSSLYYFNKVLDYRLAKQDTFGIALVYNNIASIQEQSDQTKESLENYLNARKWVQDKYESLRCDIYNGLGMSYLKMGQESLGMAYFDSTMVIADKIKQKHPKQVVYSFLKEHYYDKGQFAKAYDNLLLEAELEKEIRGEEVQKQAEVLQLQYEDEKKAKQLAVLGMEQSKEEAFNTILIIVSIAILVLAIIAIYTLRLRVRHSKLRESSLNTQLEQKNKELTSYTLNFIQKNELMTELTEGINDLKKKTDPSLIKELNRLNRIIDGNFRMDQEWENFKLMFEEVHRGFFINLRNAFPNLGNAEVKICALSRLNLNLKESASVLGISVDSVKTARYRLRKKLGLATEDNLTDFLTKFDEPALAVA